jgi:hypothetical protein
MKQAVGGKRVSREEAQKSQEDLIFQLLLSLLRLLAAGSGMGFRDLDKLA